MSSRWNFGPCRRELTRRLIETATEHHTEYGDLSSIAVVRWEGASDHVARNSYGEIQGYVKVDALMDALVP
jgi:hypothetical protein